LNKNLLIWSGPDFIHFCLSHSLKQKHDFNLFVLIDDADLGIKKFYNKQKFVNFSQQWYYYEHVKTNFQKPDLEYLKKIEQKFNLKIWEIAYSERFFYEDFYPYHKFSHDEILYLIEQECKLFEEILEKNDYDFFLTNMITRHPKLLLYKMCIAKGIHPLTLETARFGKKFTISKEIGKIENSENYKKTVNDLSDKFPNLLDYLKKYERGTGSVFGLTYKIPISKKISALSKFFFKKSSTTNYLNYGKSRKNLLLHGSRFIGSFRRRSRQSFLDQNTLNHVDGKIPFIYFPLHAEPERELLLQAPYYSNQITVITNVAKSMPVGYLLYVKEHPVMIDVNWRPIEYYKQIQNLPNVRLIHPSLSSLDLIEKCKLSVTISGDVGIESAFYGKPTIVFSKTDYSVLPFVYYVEKPDLLPSLIENALSTDVSKKDVGDYIAFTESNSFNFDEKKYLLDFNNMFYYAGFLEEQQLSLDVMEKFLNKYSKDFENMANEHLKKMKNHNKDII
jgi:hypothetical protein